MKNSMVVALVLTLAAGSALSAQMRPATPPRNSVSAYGLMYTGIADLEDPASASRWRFDDNAFGFGATLQREFGQGLLLGADVSLARPKYERRPPGGTGDTLATGTASIATAMVTGRIAYGGGSDLGLYLTGGLGTVAYNLSDDEVSGWNSDFALRAGTGIEYRFQPRAALFLEWGRLWGYHEREGIGGGRQQHSQLKLGGRFLL